MSELYKQGFCYPECPYFPDMSIRDESDWEWNEDGTYKTRKNKKIFKCMYTNQPIDWNRPCMRESDI